MTDPASPEFAASAAPVQAAESTANAAAEAVAASAGQTAAQTAAHAAAKPAVDPAADAASATAASAAAEAATQARQRWLQTLALSDAHALAAQAARWLNGQSFERLRGPDCGLVMVCARVGGEGERFNLGEVTLSRCVVRHRLPDGRLLLGVGHVMGRDLAQAERIACLDALLQREDLQADLQRELLNPLAQQQRAQQAAQQQATDASRVAFYTLQADPTA